MVCKLGHTNGCILSVWTISYHRDGLLDIFCECVWPKDSKNGNGFQLERAPIDSSIDNGILFVNAEGIMHPNKNI